MEEDDKYPIKLKKDKLFDFIPFPKVDVDLKRDGQKDFVLKLFSYQKFFQLKMMHHYLKI